MYSLSSVRQTAKVALQPFLESSRICACTVERFKRYLETDLLPHLNGNSVLAMDNMKSHHAKAVKELLDSSGVRYIYLPLKYQTNIAGISKIRFTRPALGFNADDPYFASIIGKTITQITFYAADGVYVLPVNVAL